MKKWVLILAIIMFVAAPFVGAYIARASINCGIPPIPPVGCEVSHCQCDGAGNCQWVFACD